MKTENNYTNQMALFGLYTDIFIYVSATKGYVCLSEWIENGYNGYIELKPLTNMTDEEAEEWISLLMPDWEGAFLEEGITLMEWKEEAIEHILNGTIEMAFSISQKTTDFLRSKGYALPWMDLSVDELIEYNWIKLIE